MDVEKKSHNSFITIIIVITISGKAFTISEKAFTISGKK